jgi:hypothetical protein
MRSRTVLALLAAGGASLPAAAQCDFAPTGREVILNTDFATVATSCGPQVVAGGVFVFRNITIPAGTVVRGQGTRPLILVATGNVTLDGVITASGGDGARVDTLNSANFPTPGGVGFCGGGNGGRGSPNSTARSLMGEAGFLSGNLAPLGGQGGLLSCATGCNRGSAGGGGTFATRGDPWYPTRSAGSSAVQQLGFGGAGCLSHTLAGGNPGSTVFVDSVPDNDFLGVGVDVFGRRLVVGELARPLGGQGGGGGGNNAPRCTVGDPSFVTDNKGGGGGAGGGVLAVLSAGLVRIGALGRLRADGGNGGGGEQAGSNNLGGGGGGGSGGMVVVLSTVGIEIETHGGTYGNGDYDFAISADGGIGTQGLFSGVPVAGKYPPVRASTLDATPIGGLGGMGVIELLTPPGANADNTNTVLDDNVHFVQNGVRLTGSAKQAYLAWRGWFDSASGTSVDDSGRPTNIGSAEGDIRPSPVLLPVF